MKDRILRTITALGVTVALAGGSAAIAGAKGGADDPPNHERHHRHHHHHHGPGHPKRSDRRGGRHAEPGDDHGRHAEPGDDHGGRGGDDGPNHG